MLPLCNLCSTNKNIYVHKIFNFKIYVSKSSKWLILEIIMEMCTFEYVERLELGHQAVQQYTYKRMKQVL